MLRKSLTTRTLAFALLVPALVGVLALQPGLAWSAAVRQDPAVIEEEGSYIPDLPHDHISAEEDKALWDGIQRSIRQLQSDGVLAAADVVQTVFYGWPVRLAPGHPDYAGFSVSAFSDHNAAGGSWLDYNNGSRTYDTHRGTDIALWPFSWNKVDAGDVQVIAAAAGTIIQNENITPSDHNCLVGGAGGLGNWITLQHADGRITIYGHMKYNSLTKKAVGQTVALGEFLGTVGSAGNSSGPHLHFEARTANGNSTLWTDPYSGAANPLPSGWLNQRPYHDSAVNTIATATAGPIFHDCQPTVTNIQDRFTTPMSIDFQVYFRDYLNTLPAALTIYDPNGNVFQSWTFTSATAFTRALAYHRAFSFPAEAVPGKWHFQAQYNGQTYDSFFYVNMQLVATTAAATGVGASGATLHGTVASDGTSTAVTFDYGLTGSYGAAGSPATAAQSPLAGSAAAVPVSAAIGGLACNTLYHFRVNAVNAAGTSNGGDLAFSTLACPIAVPGAPTIHTATPGVESATISFAGPASNGGSPIISYLVTCTANGWPTRSMVGETSPITVRKMPGGVMYACSVAATNGVGTGPSSQMRQVQPRRSSLSSIMMLLLD